MHIQDGFIQLSKVDTRRVSFDAAVDIKKLIQMGKGDDRLNYDAFHKLMHDVEVQGTSFFSLNEPGDMG